MTVSAMQSIDALLLFAISICCLILVAEDRTVSATIRVTICAVGFFSFAQAIWVISDWSPYQGYPWARLCLDASLCAASIARVWFIALSALGRIAALAHFRKENFTEIRRMDDARRRRAGGG